MIGEKGPWKVGRGEGPKQTGGGGGGGGTVGNWLGGGGREPARRGVATRSKFYSIQFYFRSPSLTPSDSNVQ